MNTDIDKATKHLSQSQLLHDNCGQVVVLDDDTDTMPPCPKCDGTKFH